MFEVSAKLAREIDKNKVLTKRLELSNYYTRKLYALQRELWEIPKDVIHSTLREKREDLIIEIIRIEEKIKNNT